MFKFITKPIGCILSLIFSLLLLVVVVVAGSILAIDHFAGDIAAYVVKSETGFTMTYAKQDVDVLHGSMDFEGLQITNPSQYQVPGFANFNQVAVKVDTSSLSKPQKVVESVVVDLKTATIVKTSSGSFNALDFANALKAAASGKSSSNTTAAPAGNSTATPPFLIKSLTIKVGTIEYYNGGTTAKTFTVNYSRTFTNVTDMKPVAMAVAEDFKNLGMAFMADIVVGTLTDFGTYENLAKGLLNGAGQAGQEILKGGQGVTKGLGNTLNKLNPF